MRLRVNKRRIFGAQAGSFTALGSESFAAGGLAAGVASPLIANTNLGRNGVQITADAANTAPCYILLGSGTASATNWHYSLPPGSTVSLAVGGAVWCGPASVVCAAAGKIAGVIW